MTCQGIRLQLNHMDESGNSERPLLPVLSEDPRPWQARVFTTLLRVHGRLERRIGESLAVHGLTLAQFDVLATLEHGEGISQQELAERLLVTKGNVVGLIDRVSAAGWVERRPDPDDRRVNRLSLTDRGRNLLAQAWPGQIALTRAILGTLSAGELHLFQELLDRVERAAQRGE